MFERWPGGGTGPNCADCKGHLEQPGEPMARYVARLEDHVFRTRGYNDRLREGGQKAIEAKTKALEEAKRGREAAADALRQRGEYLNLLIDIYSLHHSSSRDRSCTQCGVKAPCPTALVFDRAPRFVRNAVEAALPGRD